jgi:hypothetical protein
MRKDVSIGRAGVGPGYFVRRARPGRVTVEAHFWSPALERALRRSRASELIIRSHWPRESIAFVERFADQLSSLIVSTPHARDVAVVESLTGLRELLIASPAERVDFGRLGRLRALRLRRQRSLGSVGACAKLEELSLMSVRVSDLTPLRALRHLRVLSLNGLQGVTSLAALGRLPLQSLALVQLRRLRSLSPLRQLRLHDLEIVGCRQSRDIEILGRLGSLSRLRIDHGPALRSFSIFAGLQKLDTLEVWGTPLLDRDLSVMPLTQLRRLRTLHLVGGIRRVHDIEHVGEITSLEALRIEGAPGFASLEYLRPLKRLRVFSLWKTPIGDGDMGALLSLPALREIDGIDPYLRHYTHSVDELNAILRARGRHRHPSAAYPLTGADPR